MNFTATAPTELVLPELLVHPEAELRRRVAGGTLEAAKLVEAVARADTPVGATQQLRERHGVRMATYNGWPAAQVVNTAPYALVRHDGRTAGKRMPPPGVLREWMRFKGIIDVIRESAKYGRIEFLIARRIGREGTEGYPWLRKAAESRKDQITAIMRRWLLEGK